MDKTKLEKFAHISGRGISKALDALGRRGIDLRKAVATPIGRVPRPAPPKPKAKD
jgi:hypothetical protein